MPKTNTITEEPKLKVRKPTRQRETGSKIPIFLINGERYISLYDVRSFLKEDCNDTENKLRYDFRKKIQTFQRKRAKEILVLPQKEIVNKIDPAFKVHLNPTKKSNFIKYKHLKKGEFDYLIKDYCIPIQEDFVIPFEMDLTPHLPKSEDVSKISSNNNPIINVPRQDIQNNIQQFGYPHQREMNNYMRMEHNPLRMDNYASDYNSIRMDQQPRIINSNPLSSEYNPSHLNQQPRRISNPLSYEHQQSKMKSPPKNPLYHNNQFFERPIIYIQNNYPPYQNSTEKIAPIKIPLDQPKYTKKPQSNILPPLKNQSMNKNNNYTPFHQDTSPKQNPLNKLPSVKLQPIQQPSPHPLVKPITQVNQKQILQEHQKSFGQERRNPLFEKPLYNHKPFLNILDSYQPKFPRQSFEEFNELVEQMIKEDRIKEYQERKYQNPFAPDISHLINQTNQTNQSNIRNQTNQTNIRNQTNQTNQTNQFQSIQHTVNHPNDEEEDEDTETSSTVDSLNMLKYDAIQDPQDQQPQDQPHVEEQPQPNIVKKIKHILDICK